MIRLTHVGSLPFTSLDEACEFNAKFDLPVLFTLPRLNSKEFMISEFLTLLGLGFTDGENITLHPLNNFNQQKFEKPFNFDYCLDQFNGGTFKYQLMGPYSFWMLIKNQYNFSLDDIFDFLIGRFIDFLRPLVDRGLELFAIDEPFVQGSRLDITNKLVLFADELSKRLQIDVYIHCCGKLDTDIPEKHQGLFHLDFSLYEKSEISNFNKIKFIGPEYLNAELPTNIIANQIKNIGNLYVLPSCGLAMKKPEKTKQIFNNLVSTKASLLESFSYLT